MLRFNIIEVTNKALGFVITAMLARILAGDFGTYLYYQTIFSYLYASALFSSDYNFLVNYKISKDYIDSTAYYQTIFVKLILVAIVLLVSVFFLIPNFTKFAFWPYLMSVFATLFVYDFILYVEDKKRELIVFRFLSQLATLIGVFIFYFKLIDVYYITVIQSIQTIILTTGTFLAAFKFLPKKITLSALLEAAKKFRIASAIDISTYFFLRNFIIFFTTIEIILLTQKSLFRERDIFAEGMRLSGTLMPFALFYINFNINKIKKGYYTIITSIAVLLLLASPFYVLIFMGEGFIDRIYYYNFFIWVFVFNAFLEKDYIELLTQDHHQKKRLLLFNTIFFVVSVLLFFALLYYPVPLAVIILLFAVKLLLYYILLIGKFGLKLRYAGVITSFLVIAVLNILLRSGGYYSFCFKSLMHLKKHF